MYESMKNKYKKVENEKELIQKRNESFRRKLRPSVLKVNPKNIKAEDFIELENFDEGTLLPI